VDADADEDNGLDEIPVDDLIVDVRSFVVRLPGGEVWALHGDLDQGLIPEESVRSLPLTTVAQALGLLSDHVGEDGAPDGWFLETDPPDRLHDIELHEGVALESYGEDQLYATIGIDVPVDVDEAFENSIDQVVAPMLTHAGAVGRSSRVSVLFRHMVTVMVRFEAMTDRTVG
jgi:hypothetical protein